MCVAHTINRADQNHVYIRFLGRVISKYTVMYVVYIQFWPALHIMHTHTRFHTHALRGEGRHQRMSGTVTV